MPDSKFDLDLTHVTRLFTFMPGRHLTASDAGSAGPKGLDRGTNFRFPGAAICWIKEENIGIPSQNLA